MVRLTTGSLLRLPPMMTCQLAASLAAPQLRVTKATGWPSRQAPFLSSDPAAAGICMTYCITGVAGQRRSQ